MLMNPPPGDSYSTAPINRQATQSLATPGLQRRPILGQNITGINPSMIPGVPQLSTSPMAGQQQQVQMLSKLLMGGGR